MEMESNILSVPLQRQLNLFKRQYLQLQTPVQYPDTDNLRQEAFQKALFEDIFKDGATPHGPPRSFKFRVLKELVSRIEDSITDWNQDVGIPHPFLFNNPPETFLESFSLCNFYCRHFLSWLELLYRNHA